MKSLRTKFETFCFKHRHKGIPNLMLYITIANAVVYVLSTLSRNYGLYQVLCFDRDLILQGQVWRLLTCVCTSVFHYGNILFVVIGLICYYSLGRAVENTWGTFRFNLFYLSGILLMDAFALAFGGMEFTINGITYQMDPSYYADMGSNLNLSLFIAYATLYPQSQFLFMYIIPVKAWIFALVYLALILFQVLSATFPDLIFPHNLFPLVALANYFLFFGKDVVNVFPMSWRINFSRLFKGKPKKKTGTVPFPTAGSYEATVAKPKAPYTHRCTICGRTDISDPNLEFRYCSRCKGYFCYCQEHISNHQHIE